MTTQTTYRIHAILNGQGIDSETSLGDCYGHDYTDRDEAESHAAYLQAEADRDPEDQYHGTQYSVAPLLDVGTRVCGGAPLERYDEGTVLELHDDGRITIGWDSCCKTTVPVDTVERLD